MKKIPTVNLAAILICVSVTCFAQVYTEKPGPDEDGHHARKAQHEDADGISPTAHEHIRELIASLPSGSRVREAPEEGARGDGVRYPWMDGMRRAGIKRAFVRTEFVWRGKPTDVRVSRIVYFSGQRPRAAIADSHERPGGSAR